MFLTHIATILLTMFTLNPSQMESASSLTVMSFNIRYGTANDGDNSWPKRDHLVLDVFKDRDAEIVGVQEALAFQLDAITEKLPHYGVIGVGRDDGKTKGEYAAILYDTRVFAVDSSGTFWLSDTPDVVASSSWGNSITRICTWARLIELETGKAIYVYNAHYDHRSQESREHSSILIGERINNRRHPDPVVLIGDFNAGEENPSITHLHDDSTGPQLIHTYRAIHPDTIEVGTFNGFEGRSNGDMIDHIFTSDDLVIRDADIDHSNSEGKYPSDHFPVWTRIELP